MTIGSTAHLAILEAHDLLDVADLSVIRDLRRAGIPYIQQFTTARQHIFNNQVAMMTATMPAG